MFPCSTMRTEAACPRIQQSFIAVGTSDLVTLHMFCLACEELKEMQSSNINLDYSNPSISRLQLIRIKTSKMINVVHS
jgi:hypothetical protein